MIELFSLYTSLSIIYQHVEVYKWVHKFLNWQYFDVEGLVIFLPC